MPVLSPSHLEDGVLLLVLGAVPGGVFPGDLEALGLAVQPDQPGVHPTVHLGHQPRLQAHPPRVEGHGLHGGTAEPLLQVTAASFASKKRN